MKKFTFLLVLFVAATMAVNAQWQPTRGLYSGDVHSVIKSNGEIIAGTSCIFKSADDGKIWNVSNNGISGSVQSIRGLVKISTYLVAATNEGVYYSSDNGDNWTQSTGTASLNVWCIISKGTNLFISTSSNGVYKSINNGLNWTSSSTGITNPFLDMRTLVVKGTDIYAGSDGYGIFKSTNDGGLWTTVNTGLPGSFYAVSSLAVSGTNILAGTYGAGIYKSTNDGGLWSAVNNGVLSTDNILSMGLNGTTVYASTLLGSLYKTTDFTNWTPVAIGNFTATRFETFYQDGGDFYVGSWGFGSPEKSYGIFRTGDNGLTWLHIGITDKPVSVLEVSGSNILAGTNDVTGNSARISLFKTTEADTTWNFSLGGFTGWNTTALKASGAIVYLFDNIGPGNSLVYRSTNNGNNWTSTGFNVLNNNFESFVIAGSLIYAGDYPSGHVFVSSDNGQAWTLVNSGLTSSVHYAYALVLKGTVLFLGTDNGVYKNTVGQNNWTAVSSGLTNMYVKALVVSGSDIYAGTQGGGIFKTSNEGGLWTDVSAGIPLFTNVTCFTTSGSNIFAGTDNGVFQTTTGSSWASVNTGLTDTSVTAMVASSNYLWAGTTAHGVWKRDLSQFIANIPGTPGPISGSTTVCQGSTNTYSITAVSGATSYTWTLPIGWTGTSSTTSINAVAGSNGTISVTANNSYGSSSPQTLVVTVTPVDISVTQSGMTLTANANPATYVWISCDDDQPVPGAVNQIFNPAVAGEYAVIVSQNGCTDTSACYLADTNCYIMITGADLPYDGLSIRLSVDTTTNVSIGNSGPSQSWDYSSLLEQYQKYAEYHLTSTTPYASTFPTSNIYTYGPGNFFASLFGSAPVGTTNNGYVFWKTDNTGHWVVGYRPDGGTFAGINVPVQPSELLFGTPATYGSVFNNSSRWELPINFYPANPDTFYVRTVNKTITADACGSISTPYGIYPSVLRQHEHLVTVDSVYLKSGGSTLYSTEYSRDTLNNYIYTANGIGYPVCIVHADKNNTVKDVEYYNGPYTSVNEEVPADKDLVLYPNPARENINISISINENIPRNIFIYNSYGSLIWQKRTMDATAEVNVSGFPAGIYFVRIIAGTQIIRGKFIRE